MISATKSKVPYEVTALLRALHFGTSSTKSLQKLNDDQWRSLLEFCHTSHLTLSLAQLPLVGVPAWVTDLLARNLADNALRYSAIKSVYHGAAAALDKAGVEHIVIKGFTQAPGYVSHPELRSQSDLDLFCPPEQIEAAQAALEEIGYRPEKSVNIQAADHTHALIRLGNWEWKGNPYDPGMPLGIELHFCLWNRQISRIDLPEVESFWQRRTLRQIEGFSFRCLNPVDHLGYLSLHILRNILLRDWIIHHVRELAVFLHSHAEDHAFWDSWIELHPKSLRSLEAIAFYHSRAWFGCRLHWRIEQEIAGITSSQRTWLERFSDSSLENMFHQNKDQLWLHLSLISSPKDKWKIFRRTLLPLRIGAWNSPIVRIRNRRLVQSSSNPLLRYLNYFISRSVSHGGASIATLFRGLTWWISKDRLSAP